MVVDAALDVLRVEQCAAIKAELFSGVIVPPATQVTDEASALKNAGAS